MAKISTYTSASPVELTDKLIGTETTNNNATKNFTIQNMLALVPDAILVLPTYASDAAALAGGLVQGQLYKSAAGVVSIVL